jgi:hypothetical protein
VYERSAAICADHRSATASAVVSTLLNEQGSPPTVIERQLAQSPLLVTRRRLGYSSRSVAPAHRPRPLRLAPNLFSRIAVGD